jgi:hypothetical protein
MSGELVELYDREAIAGLRRGGKHDLADRWEQTLRNAPDGRRSTMSARRYGAQGSSGD